MREVQRKRTGQGVRRQDEGAASSAGRSPPIGKRELPPRDPWIKTTLPPGERGPLVAYLLGVAAIGIPVGVWIVVTRPLPDANTTVLLVTLGLISYHLPVMFPSNIQMNPGFPLIMSALFTHGASIAVLTLVPAHLLHFVTRKHGLANCLFNAGQFSICILVSETLGHLVGWTSGFQAKGASLVPVFVMVCSYDILNTLFLAVIIQLQESRPFAECFVDMLYRYRENVLTLRFFVTVAAMLISSFMGSPTYVLVFLGVLALRRQNVFQNELARKTLEAEKDALTGTYNLHYLTRWADHGFPDRRGRAERCSFVFLDVDDLKIVNDTFGHDSGDAALVHVADIALGTVRRGDHIVRYGGDEFVVVCPDTSLEEAQIIALRIAGAVGHGSFVHNDTTISLGVSIGVASWPAHGETYAEAIRQADKAMYLAKKRGANSVCTAEEL